QKSVASRADELLKQAANVRPSSERITFVSHAPAGGYARHAVASSSVSSSTTASAAATARRRLKVKSEPDNTWAAAKPDPDYGRDSTSDSREATPSLSDLTEDDFVPDGLPSTTGEHAARADLFEAPLDRPYLHSPVSATVASVTAPGVGGGTSSRSHRSTTKSPSVPDSMANAALSRGTTPVPGPLAHSSSLANSSHPISRAPSAGRPATAAGSARTPSEPADARVVPDSHESSAGNAHALPVDSVSNTAAAGGRVLARNRLMALDTLVGNPSCHLGGSGSAAVVRNNLLPPASAASTKELMPPMEPAVKIVLKYSSYFARSIAKHSSRVAFSLAAITIFLSPLTPPYALKINTNHPAQKRLRSEGDEETGVMAPVQNRNNEIWTAQRPVKIQKANATSMSQHPKPPALPPPPADPLQHFQAVESSRTGSSTSNVSAAATAASAASLSVRSAQSSVVTSALASRSAAAVSATTTHLPGPDFLVTPLAGPAVSNTGLTSSSHRKSSLIALARANGRSRQSVSPPAGLKTGARRVPVSARRSPVAQQHASNSAFGSLASGSSVNSMAIFGVRAAEAEASLERVRQVPDATPSLAASVPLPESPNVSLTDIVPPPADAQEDRLSNLDSAVPDQSASLFALDGDDQDGDEFESLSSFEPIEPSRRVSLRPSSPFAKRLTLDAPPTVGDEDEDEEEENDRNSGQEEHSENIDGAVDCDTAEGDADDDDDADGEDAVVPIRPPTSPLSVTSPLSRRRSSTARAQPMGSPLLTHTLKLRLHRQVEAHRRQTSGALLADPLTILEESREDNSAHESGPGAEDALSQEEEEEEELANSIPDLTHCKTESLPAVVGHRRRNAASWLGRAAWLLTLTVAVPALLLAGVWWAEHGRAIEFCDAAGGNVTSDSGGRLLPPSARLLAGVLPVCAPCPAWAVCPSRDIVACADPETPLRDLRRRGNRGADAGDDNVAPSWAAAAVAAAGAWATDIAAASPLTAHLAASCGSEDEGTDLAELLEMWLAALNSRLATAARTVSNALEHAGSVAALQLSAAVEWLMHTWASVSTTAVATAARVAAEANFASAAVATAWRDRVVPASRDAVGALQAALPPQLPLELNISESGALLLAGSLAALAASVVPWVLLWRSRRGLRPGGAGETAGASTNLKAPAATSATRPRAAMVEDMSREVLGELGWRLGRSGEVRRDAVRRLMLAARAGEVSRLCGGDGDGDGGGAEDEVKGLWDEVVGRVLADGRVVEELDMEGFVVWRAAPEA
ncbi:hypothetical protein HK405_007807, partial [Cladochytrium tenue]